MNDQAQIRVLSVDDHPLLNEGIAALINNQQDMRLVGQATSGHEAIQQYRKHQPDLTLMDLRLPDMNGIDTTIAIRGEFPDARIIMLTTFEGDADILRALEARGSRLRAEEHAAPGFGGGNPPGTCRQEAHPLGSGRPAG